MIQYFIIIIIIIIFIEIYIRYYIKTVDDCETHEPWDKIDIGEEKNKYYIKISNFNENKFIEWKKLPIKIDYDIDNNYLIIKTKSEDSALSIANLFIANMNDELELQTIIDNDLINISKLKAKTHKQVRIKLIKLIKEGRDKTPTEEHFETPMPIFKQEQELVPIQNEVKEHILYDEPLDKIETIIDAPLSMFSAYGGTEYATISFG